MNMLEPRLGIPGQKPTGPVEIDWSNPISKNLQFCYLTEPSGTRDVAGREQETLTLYGTHDIAASIGGLGDDFGNTDSDYDSISNDTGIYTIDSSSKFTFAAVFNIERRSDTRILFGQYSSASSWFTCRINSTGAGTPNTIGMWARLGNTTNVFVNPFAGNIIPTGGPYLATLVLSVDISAKTVWAEIKIGDKVYTGTNTGTGAITGSVSTPIRTRENSASAWDDVVYMRYRWDRALSKSERLAILHDPYQLLKPAGQRLKTPALAITTPPTANIAGVRVPDPKWEEPGLLVPGQKPAGPVTIDWDHPMTEGLERCFVLNQSEKDLVNGYGIRTDGKFGANEHGTYYQPGAGEYIDTEYYPGNEVTMVALTKRETVDQNLIIGCNDGSNHRVYMGFSSANNYYVGYGSAQSSATPIDESVGDQIFMLYTNDLPVGVRGVFYVNGSFAAQSTNGTFSGVSTTPILIGYASSSFAFEDPINAFFIFNRRFEPEERDRLYRDPYQFLIPA